MLVNFLFFLPIFVLISYNITSKKIRKKRIKNLLNSENKKTKKEEKKKKHYTKYLELADLIGINKLSFFFFLSLFYVGFSIFVWSTFKMGVYILVIVLLIEVFIISKAFNNMITNAYNDYFECNFPNVLKFISRNLAAGLTIYSTIKIVSTTHNGLIGREFTRISDLLNNGVPLTTAMNYGEKLYPYKGYLIFSYYLKYSVAAGSKLSDVLSTLSQDMKNALSLKQKVLVMTAEVRTASYILASLSFLMIGLSYFFNDKNFYFLMNSHTGNLIMVYVVASTSAGIMLSNKLINNVKV